MADCIIVGCGFSGSVIARYLAEVHNKDVLILERRNHIAGNMYDYLDENGILVQKYGPHTFHTNDESLYTYICRFGHWQPYCLNCMSQIDGRFTHTPFNYETIDSFYERDRAIDLKKRLESTYIGMKSISIIEMLESSDKVIKEYADFLFEKDYGPYAAKQWGIPFEEIDVSIFSRVPILLSYRTGYFEDKYQVMPKVSFNTFFAVLLSHPNITIRLKTDANNLIGIKDQEIYFNNERFEGLIVYTGALDEFMGFKYGLLPYRSLRFDFRTEKTRSFQPAPVVAYPQAKGYTRITEYTKIPLQPGFDVTKIGIEYPLLYEPNSDPEPYYPIVTNQSRKLYQKYKDELSAYGNLFVCGRLADFQYYNMDQALRRALEICDEINLFLKNGKRCSY